MAKLEPPEGGSVSDGLEVRVAFGSVWKQTLSELSGGQRSLLALSLILALLLFKPAPLYLLDEVKRMGMEQKDCSLKVEKLIEKHAWIASEKQLFGRSGTDYDFSSRDPFKAREELEKLQAEQSGLEKRVNKKVMAMFEKAEDEYNSLISKKNIIENDKSKIKMVIEELDEKKKETLKVTWVKVNNDFGSIFSTLLPVTMAKLEPPEGGSFLDGLEVRVAFGSVWKQTLSELSGEGSDLCWHFL